MGIALFEIATNSKNRDRGDGKCTKTARRVAIVGTRASEGQGISIKAEFGTLIDQAI